MHINIIQEDIICGDINSKVGHICTSNNNVKDIGDHGQIHGERNEQVEGPAYLPWSKCKNHTKNQTRNQENGRNFPSCTIKKHIKLNYV